MLKNLCFEDVRNTLVLKKLIKSYWNSSSCNIQKIFRNKNLTKTITVHLPVDRDQQIQVYKPISAN